MELLQSGTKPSMCSMKYTQGFIMLCFDVLLFIVLVDWYDKLTIPIRVVSLLSCQWYDCGSGGEITRKDRDGINCYLTIQNPTNHGPCTNSLDVLKASNIPWNPLYKSHQISKLKHYSSRLAVHWRQVLSQVWRCSSSSADRRCSNYIWVLKNCIAYQGVTYIRGFTVILVSYMTSREYCCE